MYAIRLYVVHCTHTNTHVHVYTVEHRLSGLFYTAIHPDILKIWIIGFFFEIRYICSLNFGSYY